MDRRFKRAVKILLAACLLPTYVRAEPASGAVPVIGILTPLSGNYAALGDDNRQGVEVALKVSRSTSNLKVVYSDSKADPSTAITEFRKLVGTDGAAAVFVMRSPVGMAVNPVSQSLAVPILGGVGDKDFAASNKYAFQIWSKSDEEGGFLAKTFSAKGFKKIALITTQDDWTDSVSEGFRDELTRVGGKLVLDEELLPSETDYRTVLTRMKSAPPDVIFANLGLAQIGPFLRQARDQRVSAPIYSNFWVAKKDVLESAGAEILEGVKFVEMDTNLPTLRKELESRHGSTPSGATLTTYVATLLLLQTVAQSPAIRTPQEFYSALLQQSEVRTPDGSFPIRDRCVKFPLVEKVMRNGKAITVSDA